MSEDRDILTEESDDPLVADARNFYKTELWSRDSGRVKRLLFAGNNLDKARNVATTYAQKRPLAWLTIRQRTRVLVEWRPGRRAVCP